MAEFLNQAPAVSADMSLIFNAMGKPIPPAARQAGFDACRQMGLDTAHAWSATNGCAEQLERDKPYEALERAMLYLDLTGGYRLMAMILTAAAALVDKPATTETQW